MSSVLIRNARLVNEGREFDGDLLVSNGRIVKIASSIHGENPDVEIDAQGQWLLPGMIDDQVHFRDPGSPDKGSFYTESRAAVAGGITSFMDTAQHPSGDPDPQRIGRQKASRGDQFRRQLRLSFRREQRQSRHRRQA